MNEEEIKNFIKDKLSEERCFHSICVAEQCEILASIYGVDVTKARKIGLAHDIAKELAKENKLKYAYENNIQIDEVEKIKPGLLHGKIGADICKKQFGFNEEMCNAIACHTTGKKDMNILDKILFVSDATGVDRKWDDTEYVRNLAKQDLDSAVLYLLDMTIKEKIDKKELIHIDSILAWNSLVRNRESEI